MKTLKTTRRPFWRTLCYELQKAYYWRKHRRRQRRRARRLMLGGF